MRHGPSKIHYVTKPIEPKRNGWSSCGQLISQEATSTDLDKITCKNCLAALRRRERQPLIADKPVRSFN